ncbi:hypothetical protein MMA231_03224 [Asticcacaulis sp. MM231]|uniref:hypothetical protein n=1 Tax=Asticcacaulis sp. MM231 TaxID=3157666 RepID=UPI0032D56A8E
MTFFPRYIAPIALWAAAAIAAFVAYNPPPMVAVEIPVELIQGLTHTVDFTAAYDTQYDVAVEMDQKQAKRLFPCTTDPSRFTAGPCEEVFPVDLNLKLSADRLDVSDLLTPAGTGAGGSYGGNDTYMRVVASVSLQPGRHYRLTWTSLKDGSVLSRAHPKLVINSTTRISKTNAIKWLMFMALAIVLVITGVVLATILYIRRRRTKG